MCVCARARVCVCVCVCDGSQHTPLFGMLGSQSAPMPSMPLSKPLLGRGPRGQGREGEETLHDEATES